MSASTLPAVATPWEDSLGNVWCAVPRFEVDRDEWVKVYRWTSVGWDHWHTTGAYTLHPALLAGLGRTLPAGTTPPKRVAKVVHFGGWELAAKGDVLFESLHGEQWRPAKDWPFTRDFITAAAEAFACHPALLAGLGRTLPEGPTILPDCGNPVCPVCQARRERAASTPPKRVAQVVCLGMWELAVKGDVLFQSLDGKQWRPSNDWLINRTFITAAAEAFAFAGDVLPGEE